MTVATEKITSLASYYLLGRSGLRVSPLCLGTMTFGTEWGWGAEAETSRALFNRYVEAGGNFIDTADGYTGGRSEELLGQFMRDAKNRDELVLATKFTFASRQGDPNSGGNQRKNIYQALEGSLKRLQTDYVDLYWLHAWDLLTPVEEVMSTLNDLVRAGKIRYIGFSNVPGWYFGRAQTMAELRGWEKVCALQLEYSLVERTIEREHVPAAQQLGAGICTWSPLAGGLLSGKYRRVNGEIQGQGRVQVTKDSVNPAFQKVSDRNWGIVDVLIEVAEELGRSPAQVALNWTTKRPGITSTLIGATRLEQLEANLSALAFDIPAELSAKLDQASRLDDASPYMFFAETLQGMMRGGTSVAAEPAWFRG